jgi:pyridoxal phosphate enzyme (YggS family)
MESTILKNIQQIKENIPQNVILIGVSKNQNINKIQEAISANLNDFAENYLNEAMEKWQNLKPVIIQQNPDFKLHFIGNLQSNKIKNIVNLFDVIHSLNSISNAKKIKEYLDNNPNLKTPQCFIQVKLGNSGDTKLGINRDNLDQLISYCQEISLPILGLMYISSSIENSKIEFEEVANLNKKYHFKYLSMGMSNDYQEALQYGVTHIRIGSKIFGERI